jgi:hypothetical protein
MTMAAPPVSPEAPGPSRADSIASAVLASAARGFAAFAIVTAVGVAIGLAEYAATNGAYRLWTWVKVGVLYLLSFCGVGLRVDSTGVPTFGVTETHLLFRIPMMVGTGFIVWLLFRAGRAAYGRTTGLGPGATTVAVLSVALGFAVPAFLASLPATLRFPDVAGTVSPVRWESVVLPLALASSATVAGAIWARLGGADGGRVRAMLEGGWYMFLLAVGLAFVGFLVLAAVKPDGTSVYARFVRDSGRLGGVTIAHHVLLLPDQSIWLLGPAMGGSTRVAVTGVERFPSTITLSGIDEGALGLFLDPTGAFDGGGRLALGGGFYLFLLAPLAATVFGGRRAAAGARDVRERALRGLASGVVFALLIAAAAWFSASALPLPMSGGIQVLPVSIRPTMPSTALLALLWGAAGGVLGALTRRRPASGTAGTVDQELAAPLPD